MTYSIENTLNTPVFIVGPLRSGTTLLRLLLGRHADINMFGEFEGAVCQAQGNSWPQIGDYHEFIANDRQMQSHNFTINPNLDYGDLVYDFLKQAHERSPSKWVGASVHSRIDLLPKLWPKGKFIHILRDPRDVANSCIGMGWVGNVYAGASYWLEPEKHWDILLNIVPQENTLTVSYEELVTSPESVLTRICQFLNLNYDENMLNIDQDSTYSKPSGQFANQWKKKLSSRQRLWVEEQCYDLMKDRGYATESTVKPSLSIIEKVFLKFHSRLCRAYYSIRSLGLFTWLAYILLKTFGPKPLFHKIQNRINTIYAERIK